MRKFVLTLMLAAAIPALANPTLFSKYESIRQALLAGSLPKAQAGARELAAAARTAKNAAVAQRADSVVKAADLEAARTAFAPLSDEMIKLRSATTGAKPAVYYCPMVKKSWLQPKGKIGNPYDESMEMCGELKSE
jgi:hypothetical protein